LVDLTNRLIKQFGSTEVTNREVFIRPYLLLANVHAVLGDNEQLKVAYKILSGIIHDLYGDESELEMHILPLETHTYMFTLEQLMGEMQQP
jgi:hypothetical protein